MANSLPRTKGRDATEGLPSAAQPALLISSELLVIACMALQRIRIGSCFGVQKCGRHGWGLLGLPQGLLWLVVLRMPMPTDWQQFIILSINVGPRQTQSTFKWPLPASVMWVPVWVCIIRKPKVIILSN